MRLLDLLRQVGDTHFTAERGILDENAGAVRGVPGAHHVPSEPTA